MAHAHGQDHTHDHGRLTTALALLAMKLAKRKASRRRTFGYIAGTGARERVLRA
jgi:Co/Zn/Cd efflux system component